MFASAAIVMLVGGDPLCFVAANSSALMALGAPDPAALTARLLSGQPAARWIAAIYARTTAGAPALIEALRFFTGGHTRSFAFACRKVATSRGDVLVLTTASRSQPRKPDEPLAAGIPRKPKGQQASAAMDCWALQAVSHAARITRFTWHTDADHRIVALSATLARHVGEHHTLRRGDVLPERLVGLGADPQGCIAQALAELRTWHRIELFWPRGSRNAVRIELSGSPLLGEARQLLGHHGFGIIRVDVSAGDVCAVPADDVSNARTKDSVDRLAVAGAGVSSPKGDADGDGAVSLSASEHNAFDELARDLQARLRHEEPADATSFERPSGEELAEQVSPPPSIGSEADFATVLDRLPVGVLIARHGAALYLNTTLLELLGHPDLEAFRSAGDIGRMLCGRGPSIPEERAVPVMRADGEILFVDAHVKTVAWSGSVATQIAIRPSVQTDNMVRAAVATAAWQAAERENAQLHAVLDTATDGVALLDQRGRIVSLNRSAEALFGRRLSDVHDELFTDLLAPENRVDALVYLDGLSGSGIASIMNDGREVFGLTAKGGFIPIFLSIGRLPSDEEPRYCAVLRDLTPWKRIESDLDEERRAAELAARSKTDFLGRICNNVHTGLESMLASSRRLLDERFGPLGSERLEASVRDIHASGTQLMRFVAGLRDLTRIQLGDVDLKFASVDVNRVVSDCLAEMEAQADLRRVIVRLALAPRLPCIVADDRSLRQIIQNLLSNAIKFNNAGGQVIVSTALTDAGNAVVRIRDTGAGMSEAEMRAALEPVQHASMPDGALRWEIGLPVIKALAEANRATLHIKSMKSEGTLVEVSFPATRVLSN